jgi:PAS domain S-box-containing protein
MSADVLRRTVGDVLFEDLPDALLVLRSDLGVERANPAAQSLFLNLDKLPETFMEGCRAACHNPSAPVVLQKDDGSGWLELTASPVEENEFLLRVRDVSEIKAFEAALKQRDERAKLIVKATNDVIWWADPQRGFVEPQDAWEEFTGQTFDEYKHWGHVQAIHPEDRDRVQNAWMEASAEKRVCTCEYRVYCPSKGEYRHCYAKGVPVLSDSGDLREWVGTLTDIHDLKLTQSALQQLNSELESRVAERTAALQASVKELEGVTHAISHDLRTAMRGVLTNAVVLERSGHPFSEEERESLRRLMFGTKRLSELVDGLLILNRLSRAELQLTDVDLSELARCLAEEVSALYKDRRLEFKVHPGMRAMADATQLELALTNLIENAAKFSPEGGVIEIGHEEGAFFVRDQGIGFEMQYADRIFEPFQRLHRDQDFPGTGIGLANVARVMERHGGRVWVDSSPGNGGCFWFEL